MERVLQARIIFWAVEMLVRAAAESVRCCNKQAKGAHTGRVHFFVFEDGGSEFLLDVADAVEGFVSGGVGRVGRFDVQQGRIRWGLLVSQGLFYLYS